jgi:hypothetical protein
MELGRLKKLVQKYEEKKYVLSRKEATEPDDREVSSGIIRVI